jgi:predicted ArsR family transcriptional regulator
MVFRGSSEGSVNSVAADIASISVLEDPVRAAVFAFVSRSGGEVSRDQAAAALGVTRRVAAFHLDRLADEGWLSVTFRRLSARTGPGAGRPSKLYRRSQRAVRLSVPPRNYELLARLLASALVKSEAARHLDQPRSPAFEFGRQIGASAKARAGRHPSHKQLDDALQGELADQGYEPFVDDGVIRLRNCPYHELARANKDLVCGMNLALMQGVTQGIGVSALAPVRDEREGLCCVVFQPA